MRRLFRWAIAAFGAVFALNVGLFVFLAFPGWAYPYSVATERLSVHAASPLPPVTADWAREVMARLDAGPLPPGGRYHIYITGGGWRERVFMIGAPAAGGLVYPLASHRVTYLSNADVSADRLLKGDFVIPPPRTLTYYALHEITHLVQLERYGLWGYLRMGRLVREGVADAVALGPAGAETRAAVAAYDGRSAEQLLALRMAHGAYPEERVQVTDWAADKTLDALMRSAIEGGPRNGLLR